MLWYYDIKRPTPSCQRREPSLHAHKPLQLYFFLPNAFPDFVPGFLHRPFALAAEPVPEPNTRITASPTGLPCPEQASHPGPAENAPLPPCVMSRKAFVADAA